MLPLREVPRDVLACPGCRAALVRSPGMLRCAGCGRAYAQPDAGWVDLVHAPPERSEPAGWRERQAQMEASYRELIADPAHTVLAYRNDFGPFAARLAEYTGRVLDVGGGNGLVRHFLPAGVDYVSADPCERWLSAAWRAVEGEFPCLAEPLAFVRSFGEALPFASGAFDGALSFWSLNHAEDPAAVVREVARALRDGGRWLLVLDDVPPAWRDVLRGAYLDERCPARRQQAWWKLRALARGWPLAPDHLRIRERDLARWLRGRFDVAFRGFVGAYLALELRKRGVPAR